MRYGATKTPLDLSLRDVQFQLLGLQGLLISQRYKGQTSIRKSYHVAQDMGINMWQTPPKCNIRIEIIPHLGSQQPSPNVKNLCTFEPQIWLEIITSRDAQSTCFKGSQTSCTEIIFGVFWPKFGRKKITSRDGCGLPNIECSPTKMSRASHCKFDRITFGTCLRNFLPSIANLGDVAPQFFVSPSCGVASHQGPFHHVTRGSLHHVSPMRSSLQHRSGVTPLRRVSRLAKQLCHWRWWTSLLPHHFFVVSFCGFYRAELEVTDLSSNVTEPNLQFLAVLKSSVFCENLLFSAVSCGLKMLEFPREGANLRKSAFWARFVTLVRSL